MPRRHPDLLIIGAGIVGLSVARAARAQWPDAVIRVVDAASGPGTHASGRNSGVLHAGLYYAPDSLKARFCREGNRLWKIYCEERDLPLRRCGKLVVATDEDQQERLQTLHHRARQNGAVVELVAPEDARAIEPRVRSAGPALWSPETATVSPRALLDALIAELDDAGVQIDFGTPWRRLRDARQQIGDEWIEPGHTINCAGLWSLRIARQFGVGGRYTVLPFRGRYRIASRAGWLRTLVYPIPDPRFPFLGTHLTVMVDGAIKLGPTAAPGLWYRQYHGLRHFRRDELAEIAPTLLRWLIRDRRAWRHVAAEFHRWLPGVLAKQARQLVDIPHDVRFDQRGPTGIRGQLACRTTGRLVDDFVIESGERSTHLLNTVSPGLTSAPAVGRTVVKDIAERIR